MKKVKSLRPKQVRILGREYDIMFKDDIGAMGLCYTTQGKIEVQEGQHPVEEADTVLHEILHAIHFLMDIGLSSKTEESVVRKTATALTQVLLDNPKLVTYIVNSGPLPRSK